MSKIKLKIGSDSQKFPSMQLGKINLQRKKAISTNKSELGKHLTTVIFLSLLIIASAASYGLYLTQNNASSLYEHRLKTVSYLMQIDELLVGEESAIRNSLSADLKSKKIMAEPLINNLEANNVAILDLISAVKATAKAPKDKESLDNFLTAYDEWFKNNIVPSAQAVNANNLSLATQLLENMKAQKELLLQQTKNLSNLQLGMAKAELAASKDSLYLFLSSIALLSIATLSIVSFLLNRERKSIEERLGADPKYIIDASGNIASGNLNFKIVTRDADHSSALAALKAIQEEFKLLMLDTEILNKSMSEGKMLGRRNLDQHQGDFRKLAELLNIGIDHALAQGQESEKRRRGLQIEIEKTESEILNLKNAFHENKLNHRLSVGQGGLSMNLIHAAVNDCLEELSATLTVYREQTQIPLSVCNKIENLQNSIKSATDEQMRILKDSYLKHDEIAMFNIINSKKAKYTQEFALKISKLIEEILSNLQNNLPSNTQNHSSAFGYDALASKTQPNEEYIFQLSQQLEQLKEFSNEIMLDSNGVIVTNMEQNIAIGKLYENYIRVEQLREKNELFVDRSLAILSELKTENFIIDHSNTEESSALGTDDAAMKDNLIQEDTSTETSIIRSDKVLDLDWKLF